MFDCSRLAEKTVAVVRTLPRSMVEAMMYWVWIIRSLIVMQLGSMREIIVKNPYRRNKEGAELCWCYQGNAMRRS